MAMASACTCPQTLVRTRTTQFSVSVPQQTPVQSRRSLVGRHALLSSSSSGSAVQNPVFVLSFPDDKSGIVPAMTSRRRRSVRSEVAVELGGTLPSETGAAAGNRIKITASIKVYHIPTVPEFDLQGCEGEIRDILGEWKGKSVSANLPLKTQFKVDIDGKSINFVAHVKDGEYKVV